MIKPIFRKWSRRGRRPTIQIGILRSIVLNGQVSKSTAATILSRNYGDVSDAMDELLSGDKKFIELSYKDRRTRNPEKFYKITEQGIRALLNADHSIEIFWKTIMLLCINSKTQLSEDEFEDYYRNFEFDKLGHSSMNGHLLLSHLLEDIIKQWFSNNGRNHIQNRSFFSPEQVILECLAYNGSLTLRQLVKNSNIKNEVVLAILNDHLVSNAITTTNDSIYGLAGFNFSNQKKNYANFILHNLIVSVGSGKEARYELSLCGLILVIALIYRHYTRKDNSPTSNTTNTQRESTSTSNTPFVLYIKVSQEKYFDKIATNYLTKLPLIFGRWNDFKEKFGSLLYDSFNFLISREARFNSINKSIWLGGNKEFYDDLKALAEDTHVKLYPIYIDGLDTMKRFEEYPNICNSSKIAVVRKKLYEIGEILKYTDIEYGLRATRNGNEPIQASLHLHKPHVLNLGPGQAKALEEILKNEINFLYFLNWNTIAFSKDKRVDENKTTQTIKHPFSLISGLTIPIRDMQELANLGSPQNRLLEVLRHDKDIREFFSRYLEDIINYRKKTLDNMSKLYRNISKFSQTSKKNNIAIEFEQIEHKNTVYTQEDTEYDIRKICSNVTL